MKICAICGKNIFFFGCGLSTLGLIINSSVLIFLVPSIIGITSSIFAKKDNIFVRFEDNSSIKTLGSTNIEYIEKTYDYFFIYNSIKKTTSVYKIDKVKIFEIIPNKNHRIYYEIISDHIKKNRATSNQKN